MAFNYNYNKRLKYIHRPRYIKTTKTIKTTEIHPDIVKIDYDYEIDLDKNDDFDADMYNEITANDSTGAINNVSNINTTTVINNSGGTKKLNYTTVNNLISKFALSVDAVDNIPIPDDTRNIDNTIPIVDTIDDQTFFESNDNILESNYTFADAKPATVPFPMTSRALTMPVMDPIINTVTTPASLKPLSKKPKSRSKKKSRTIQNPVKFNIQEVHQPIISDKQSYYNNFFRSRKPVKTKQLARSAPMTVSLAAGEPISIVPETHQIRTKQKDSIKRQISNITVVPSDEEIKLMASSIAANDDIIISSCCGGCTGSSGSTGCTGAGYYQNTKNYATYSLSSSQTSVASTSYINLAYFPWDNSRYNYKNGTLVFNTTIRDSNIMIRVVDKSELILGDPVIYTTTDTHNLSFNTPTDNTVIVVQAVKTSADGDDPVVYGLNMEFETN